MKRKILYLLFIVGAVVSCHSQHDAMDEIQGIVDQNLPSGVCLNITINNSYAAGQSVGGSASKTLVADDYPMTLSHMAGGIIQGVDTLSWWDDLSKMPAVVDLNVGNYKFLVKTAGRRDSINMVPYYEGEKSFEVVENKVSSEYVDAVIRCMAISCSPSDILPLTDYTMSYYDLKHPQNPLITIGQQQNQPKPLKIYMDVPFAFGVKINGRVNGLPWIKNVLVWDNINVGSYQNLILE